jgi:hypothetical protein
MITKNKRGTLAFEDLPSSERILSKGQRMHKTPKRGCGKVRLSREQAKDIVRRAFYLKAYSQVHGLVSGNRRESRIYACLSCGVGVWHTTSKGDRFQQSVTQEVCIEAAA